ncbi:MAG: ABC transporter substrate-binding protein, partial [Oscillibacter sp.]|nr:ABC transporter substrate-binding protein [Oscillibacter sp.]
MKKVFALALAAAMTLALAACGAKEEPAASTPAASTPAASTPAASTPAEKAPEDYEGEIQLYSTMTEADLDALITCFNEKYPNIEVIVTNGSAGELTTRIDGEKGNPQGDLVWGGMA